jgi:hypothetical protein
MRRRIRNTCFLHATSHGWYTRPTKRPTSPARIPHHTNNRTNMDSRMPKRNSKRVGRSWEIWKERNRRIFHANRHPPALVRSQARDHHYYWNRAPTHPMHCYRLDECIRHFYHGLFTLHVIFLLFLTSWI